MIIFKEFFKYILLNCTMDSDACKTTCLIGDFIEHLNHFWLDFLRLLLDVGVQNCIPGHYFQYRHATGTKNSFHNALN